MLAAFDENIIALQQPGSLGPQATLPAVIQDAMESVRRMGERYLWVDRLCIKQNSAGKHKELARMDIIFSHALLTIAAIDGADANASLPGVRPESRLPVQRLESIQDNLFISEPPPLGRFLKDCVYETRGWTFQERCFSPRILYISEQQIYFQCQKSIRSESHVQERHYWAVSNRVNKIRLRGSWSGDFLKDDSESARIPKQYWLSELPIYQDLVETYSSRKLTYTMDVVSAFAGFSSVFEECCGGPVLSAMPMAALGGALLWIGCDGIQRRTAGGSVIFPSWSWAGWEGPVRYPILMRLGRAGPVYSRLESVAIYSTTATENRQGFNDVSQSNSPSVHVIRRAQNYSSHPAVDLLRFTAPTATFDAFGLQESRSRIKNITYCFLTPRDSAISCGVILGISVASAESVMPGSMELVILSHDFTPTSSAQLHASYGVSIPTFRTGKQRNSHHTLNILLVKRNGDYYERVAVGKMYSGAWTALAQDMRKETVIVLA
jgi:hypothetical protein